MSADASFLIAASLERRFNRNFALGVRPSSVAWRDANLNMFKAGQKLGVFIAFVSLMFGVYLFLGGMEQLSDAKVLIALHGAQAPVTPDMLLQDQRMHLLGLFGMTGLVVGLLLVGGFDVWLNRLRAYSVTDQDAARWSRSVRASACWAHLKTQEVPLMYADALLLNQLCKEDGVV